MKKILLFLFVISTLVLSSCAKKPDTQNIQNSKEVQEQAPQPQEREEDEKIQAPDFELTSLKGRKVKLSDYRGKVVMLNFFATWCPPCKAEFPGFMKTVEDYKDRNVEFIFVDIGEDNKTVEKFLKERNYDIDPLMDRENEVFTYLYGLRGIPTTFVIDTEGNIVFGNPQFTDEATLRAAIDKALNQK